MSKIRDACERCGCPLDPQDADELFCEDCGHELMMQFEAKK